jgi:hypothetical protein
MAHRDALLEDLLKKSTAIELAVRNGSRILNVPLTAAFDTCVNALHENEKAVDYIIRTQDC